MLGSCLEANLNKLLVALFIACSLSAQTLPPIHLLEKPTYYYWSSKRFKLVPIAVKAGERIEIIEECDHQPDFPCAVGLKDQYGNKCKIIYVRGGLNFAPVQQNG